jgi:two-component system NtrC family sensor kinase
MAPVHHGLKVHGILLLMGLLFFAMVTLDLVILHAVANVGLGREAGRAHQALRHLISVLACHGAQGLNDGDIDALVESHFPKDARPAAVVIIDAKNRITRTDSLSSDPGLAALARDAMTTATTLHRFHGATWGVFWKQPRYIFYATPVGSRPPLSKAVAIAWPLDGWWASLRHIQRISWLFLFVNLGLLTLFGIFRFYRLMLMPLKRLLNRAESIQGDADALFMPESGQSEFSRLSRTLNRILSRNLEQREALKSTVNSLKEANRRLKTARQEMLQAEKLAAVGRLSAGVAHEIGNPIGIVLGYLDLLKQPDIPEASKKEFLQRSETEIQRVRTILRQLVTYARPSPGGIGPVAVHALIEEIMRDLSHHPLLKGIHATLSLKAADDTVSGDPDMLRQVLLNLIINAVDAIATRLAPTEATLLIGTDTHPGPASRGPDEAGWLEITVQDNGIGICPEHLNAIFDPFFTTKDPGKGTGLGLAVSYRIIHEMGGRLAADSRVGQGTSMRILLPCAPRGLKTEANIT